MMFCEKLVEYRIIDRNHGSAGDRVIGPDAPIHADEAAIHRRLPRLRRRLRLLPLHRRGRAGRHARDHAQRHLCREAPAQV